VVVLSYFLGGWDTPPQFKRIPYRAKPLVARGEATSININKKIGVFNDLG